MVGPMHVFGMCMIQNAKSTPPQKNAEHRKKRKTIHATQLLNRDDEIMSLSFYCRKWKWRHECRRWICPLGQTSYERVRLFVSPSVGSWHRATNVIKKFQQTITG